ncbi:MAG TPA: serine hydrolase domain-containing protein [Actinoplanes sp.]
MLRRMLLGSFVAASLVVPAAVSPASAVPPVAGRGGGDGALLQDLLEGEHAAGMPGVYAQVRDGRQVYNVAAGVADVDTGRPARPWLRHRVGSITKTFVATTVLQLVGERRIRLDAPIGRYLPGVVPGTTGRQVTVRMLLNHTSGIGNYTDQVMGSADAIIHASTHTFTKRQLARIGLAMPPTNAPGAQWSYSNTNYILLGLLIEKVTGHRYGTEVERRILRPLKLRHTYLPGTDPTIRGPHAAAYVPGPDGTLYDFSVFNMSWASSAGELVSTAADLNTFYRALLTGRLLSPPLLAEMQTTVPFYADMPGAGGYGLGLYWLATPCGPRWGHNGGVIGQTTESYHSIDGRRQVSVGQTMTNFAPPGVDHPIYEAHNRFMTAAMCGTQPAVRAATAEVAVPPSLRADLTPAR